MPPPNVGFKKILLSSGSWKIKTIKWIDYFIGSFIACLTKDRKPIGDLTIGQLQRILIIRPGGIGDAVFLIPLLRAIKKKIPSTTVDILCEQRNHQIFLSQTDTHDNLYLYDGLKSFRAVIRNEYDLVMDTEQWHYLSALTAYFLTRHRGESIGFATRKLRSKLFGQRIAYEINTYEMDNFNRLFQPLLLDQNPINNINNCFQIKKDLLEWAAKTIPPTSVAVFVGASIPERRLTSSQSQELIRSILKKNFSVVLLGGRDVQDTGRRLEKEIGDSRLFNFVGKISLEQSAALIKTSKIFIGPDSGLMHLACAVGTPTIGIFGPGNLKKWAPQGDRHTIITENVECSPCTQFGYTIPTCNGSYHCMRNISIAKLISAL